MKKYRQQYDGTEEVKTISTAVTFEGAVDLAVQAEKESTDINELVRRFGVTKLPSKDAMPFYGDFSEVSDYQSALEEVRYAQERFMELPSSVRKRFDNDPAQLLAFVSNDENRREAEDLGLVGPKVPTAPVPPVDTGSDSSGGAPAPADA